MNAMCFNCDERFPEEWLTRSGCCGGEVSIPFPAWAGEQVTNTNNPRGDD